MTALLLGGVMAVILAAFAFLLRGERDAGAREATTALENKAQAGRIEALEQSKRISREVNSGAFSDVVDAL